MQTSWIKKTWNISYTTKSKKNANKGNVLSPVTLDWAELCTVGVLLLITSGVEYVPNISAFDKTHIDIPKFNKTANGHIIKVANFAIIELKWGGTLYKCMNKYFSTI